jgi:predicted nucleic acid-binding protein
MTSAETVFLDSNVLIAASVEEHPSHAVARALAERLAAAGSTTFVSPQVCREFLSVMTRAPVAGLAFSTAEALEVLGGWLAECSLLDETGDVVGELFRLVARYDVKGKKVHDANVVATLTANRITRLATLNQSDFRRYEDLVSLEPVTS